MAFHSGPNIQHVGGRLIDEADGVVGLDDDDAVGHGGEHGFEAGVVVFQGAGFGLEGLGGVRDIAMDRSRTSGPPVRGKGSGPSADRRLSVERVNLAERSDFAVHQAGGEASGQHPAENSGDDQGASEFARASASVPMARLTRMPATSTAISTPIAAPNGGAGAQAAGWAASADEPVADAADGLDAGGVGGVVLDLAADAADVDGTVRVSRVKASPQTCSSSCSAE